MDILGIGLQELFFILVIILLVARPKDIATTARNLGRTLNRLYKSPNYQVIRRASQEIRNLPARLAREAQLEELEELKLAQKDLQDAAQTIGESTKPFKAWVEEVKPGSGAPAGGRAAAPLAANGPRAANPSASPADATNDGPAGGPANATNGAPAAGPAGAADDPGAAKT